PTNNPVLLTFDDGYKDLVQYAFPILERHGFGATVYIVTSHLGATNIWDQQTGSAPHELMNLEEVQIWSQRGIEFGSHTCSHPDLVSLGADEVDRELLSSSKTLGDL